MAKEDDITAEMCRQLVRYDPQTGKLFWRWRSREWFADQRAFSSWNAKHADREAFIQPNDEGYLRGVMLRRTFRAQRVAWAVFHGHWPAGEIDHINGLKADNRIENLRDVPKKANCRNRRIRSDNRSGATGVALDLNTMRWRATIRALGRNVHLGVFDTKESAVAARAAAQAEYGYHPNHGGTPR